jgi:S1-C subfamily serine protease
VPITLEHLCPAAQHAPATSGSKQIVVDVKSGQEYYVLIHMRKFELVQKEDIEKHLKKASANVMQQKENLDQPINEKSIVESRKGPGQGSGFLVNSDGYIITNFHVIEDAEKVHVRGIKGDYSTRFVGKVISVDRQNDLALLQVVSKLFSFEKPPYSIGESKYAKTGQSVFAFGYPLSKVMGSEVKVTNGIINATTGYKGSISEFQISASVQPGNSGGPLLNGNGEVIGVVTSKISAKEVDAVGYTVKSDYLKFFLDQNIGVTYETSATVLTGKELPEQVELVSPYVYIIETE